MSFRKDSDWNFPAFNQAAEKLRNMGYVVCNPAENIGGYTGMSRNWYLKHDLKQLMDCESIVLIDQWWRSNGATMEFVVADTLNMPAYFWNGKELVKLKIDLNPEVTVIDNE